MNAQLNVNELDAVIERAITTDSDDETLMIIAAHAEDILDRLDNSPALFNLLQSLDQHPERSIRFFQALGMHQQLAPAEEQRAWDESLRMETKAADVGKSWSDTLLKGLDPSLRDMEQWFATAPPTVNGDALNWYLADLSARGAGGAENPNVLALARRGLTPASFIIASDCISTYVNPLKDDLTFDENREVYLWIGDNGQLGASPFNASMLIDSVAKLCECAPAAAERLLTWLVKAAMVKPLLFKGILAAPTDGDQPVRLGLAYLQGRALRFEYDQRWASDVEWPAVITDNDIIAGQAVKDRALAVVMQLAN